MPIAFAKKQVEGLKLAVSSQVQCTIQIKRMKPHNVLFSYVLNYYYSYKNK